MEIAYITAITAVSALTGSVIGGLTSAVTKWKSVRLQARAGDLARRQDLFKDFMVAASKSYGNALLNSEPQLTELVTLYALMSQIRVLCSSEIVDCADRVLRLIIDTYFGPNRTVRELHELIGSGSGIDPLREFSDLARKELKAFVF